MDIPNVDFTFVYLFMFFAIPGLVFRKFYYQGEFSKQFVAKNWVYTLTSSFVLGLIIQIISFYSVKGFFQVYGKPTKEEYLIRLSDFKNIKHVLDGLSLYEFTEYDKQILIIFGYVIITCVISFFSAIICWHLVRGLKLDRKFKLLRFGNIWNYYLRGEIIDFKDFININENKNVILTLVDIVISDGFKENKLFSGVLAQYTINSKDNSLETITLTDTHVWKKDQDPNSNTYNRNIKFRVKGHCLILDVKKSIDLNLTYVYENEARKTWKVRVLEMFSFLLVLTYLFLFVLIIVSFNPIFLISTSIIYTILLKLFFLVMLTMVFTIVINVTTYLKSRRNWTQIEKSKQFKGVLLILIYTIFSMLIYRYIRYEDFLFWFL